MEKYNGDQVPSWIKRDEDGMPLYPMAGNLKVRPECLGLELPFMPFADKTSAQRINMFTTSIAQALIVRGAEFPQVASGYEAEYAKYTFNSSRFDQDGMILRIIPRYRTNVGADPIKKCPSWLVIWYGEEDNKVHSNWVHTYYKGTNGFGWENKIDWDNMAAGIRVTKNQCLSHSNAIQSDRYCLGVNANTCYGTWPGTTEDAIVISDEFAKRTIATGYREIVIDIDKNHVPINLYGDAINYKFLPDIGEKISEGGIICGFRKVDSNTFYTDFTDEALSKMQLLHDDIYYQTEPGATVVDITMVRNPNRKILTPTRCFQQIAKYEEFSIDFYEQVVKAYTQECVEKGRIPSQEFITMTTYSARMLSTVKKRVLGVTRRSLAKFKRKDMPIEHIQLTLVLKYDIKPSLGSKFVSYYGDKGTISKVVPKKHMPINDHGVQADMLISPMSIPNRMNPGQIYMTFISELCRVVIEKMQTMDDKLAAYDYMVEFFNDVNPEYVKLVEKVMDTPEKKRRFVDENLRAGYLVVVCPPYLDGITTDWVLRMVDKYGIKQTPVEFDKLDSEGRVVRRIRTKRNMFIGKKYIFTLCKVPHCKCGGMGYVTDIGVPITVKDATIKAQTQVSPTAIRCGEDESRMIANMLGAELASRMLGLYANSPDATQELTTRLLSMAKPTQLDFIPWTNKKIINSSRTISALQAMMAVTGIDLENCTAQKDEIDTLYAPLKTEVKVPRGRKAKNKDADSDDSADAVEPMDEEEDNA